MFIEILGLLSGVPPERIGQCMLGGSMLMPPENLAKLKHL